VVYNTVLRFPRLSTFTVYLCCLCVRSRTRLHTLSLLVTWFSVLYLVMVHFGLPLSLHGRSRFGLWLHKVLRGGCTAWLFVTHLYRTFCTFASHAVLATQFTRLVAARLAWLHILHTQSRLPRLVHGCGCLTLCSFMHTLRCVLPLAVYGSHTGSHAFSAFCVLHATRTATDLIARIGSAVRLRLRIAVLRTHFLVLVYLPHLCATRAFLCGILVPTRTVRFAHIASRHRTRLAVALRFGCYHRLPELHVGLPPTARTTPGSHLILALPRTSH